MQPRLKDVPVLGRNGFLRLAYAEWGPPDAEQTVVCVHGLSRNGRDFDVLAAELAVDISATAIRAALQRGDGADSLIPPVVLDYIEQHNLYKN